MEMNKIGNRLFCTSDIERPVKDETKINYIQIITSYNDLAHCYVSTMYMFDDYKNMIDVSEVRGPEVEYVEDKIPMYHKAMEEEMIEYFNK